MPNDLLVTLEGGIYRDRVDKSNLSVFFLRDLFEGVGDRTCWEINSLGSDERLFAGQN